MEKKPSRITQKCCFCLPLRRGLIFLAYLNVIGGALALALDVVGENIIYYSTLTDHVVEATGLNNLGIYYLPYFLDLAFGAALIYALHKNDTLVLYAYIWCSVTYITIVIYIGCVIWQHVLNRNLCLLIISVNVFYQGFMAFLVRNMRVEIIRNTEGPADKKSHSQVTNESHSQATNESDVESQPLPTAPVSTIVVQDNTSL